MFSKVLTQESLYGIVDISDLKRIAVIPQANTTYDEELTIMLNTASRLAQAYTRCLLTTGTVACEFYASELDDKMGIMLPFASNTTSIDTILIDGVDATNYSFSDISTRLTVSDVFYECQVTYSTGYDVIPDDVRLGILMMANTFFNNRDDFIPNMEVNEIPTSSTFILNGVKRFV